MQLWLDAAAHDALKPQYQLWGGLWTATNAETFAVDAVRMYTSEAEWQSWQERGFQLLSALYYKDDRLKTVQV